MMWTVIVCGKAGFLRKHKVNCSKVEDFVTESWPKWNGFGKMPYIMYHLLGKRDSRQYMTMWCEDMHYLTDPVIILFWWLCYSGIREGFIFPSLSSVVNGIFSNSQPITYKEIYNLYQETCSSCFMEITNTIPKTGLCMV